MGACLMMGVMTFVEDRLGCSDPADSEDTQGQQERDGIL